ncbi:MAG: hypothetical protein ACXW1S_08835 [Acidimicrobiia bacterium]
MAAPLVPLSADPVVPLGADPAGAGTIPGAPGCTTAPADSYWHARADTLPVHPSSSTWVASAGASSPLHPDFGAGLWNGGPIGIPFVTVPGTQPQVPITFLYDDESDPGPYPIPANAPIEGGAQSGGDRHVLVVDRDRCRLYEVYAASPQDGGTSWTAGSGAVWDLTSNAFRPATWTSADAAGMPILPGLVRFDEIAAGEIDHAIRITLNRTDNRYVWPATHRAGSGNSANAPMGQRFRLKASVDIAAYPPQAQVVLRALKLYGAIVADNGSSWFISGAPDDRLDNDDLRTLRNLRGSDFEAVDSSSLIADPSSGRVAGTPTTTTPGPPPPRVHRDRRPRPRTS